MNLFRSEEHARRWARFEPAMEKTLRPLSYWAEVFAGEMFRSRARPDFLSWLGGESGRRAVAATLAALP